jgi:hypothetical protein
MLPILSQRNLLLLILPIPPPLPKPHRQQNQNNNHENRHRDRDNLPGGEPRVFGLRVFGRGAVGAGVVFARLGLDFDFVFLLGVFARGAGSEVEGAGGG